MRFYFQGPTVETFETAAFSADEAWIHARAAGFELAKLIGASEGARMLWGRKSPRKGRPLGTLKLDVVNPYQRDYAASALRAARRAGAHGKAALNVAADDLMTQVTHCTADDRAAYSHLAWHFVAMRMRDLAPAA